MVSVMCCQYVNTLDAQLADSVTHAPSVLTQVYSFLFNLKECCTEADRRTEGGGCTGHVLPRI